ncbi:hypothetical protein KCP69_12160 [Salmonella enterica subsp. enterica]|nr:hypothetical protein KCP69_12160 [Salmonella enterica subsp. enterica]
MRLAMRRAPVRVETLAQKISTADIRRARVGSAQRVFNAGIRWVPRERQIPALREQVTACRCRVVRPDASIQLTSALGGGYHS